MHIRVLGCHGADQLVCGADGFVQQESRGFLIDGSVLLDAGTVGTRLTLAEQRRIRVVLLSHLHIDHIKSLPTLADNLAESFDGPHVWHNRRTILQDAQKGRPARSQGARRPKRIPFPPPTPSCQDSSITGGTLQGDGRLRATPGKRRVSARRGRAGEKSDFFSILLVRKLRRLDLEWRPREGFEKREQVRFFFFSQTKWLHEGTQTWIGPTAFV